jgi:CRAL/TRIO domain.
MAESIEEIDERLSKLYRIKRPVYNENDLERVKVIVGDLFTVNKHWKSEWMHEEALVRFLKAFLNVRDTVNAITEYCNWRHKEDVDGVQAINIEGDENMMKEQNKERDRILYDHYDRCGRPILLVSVRNHDKQHNDYETLFRYSLYCLENLIRIADERAFDKRIVLIFDLNGFGMANMDYRFVKQTLHVLKTYYPERIGTCFIINYPWIFLGCWKIIKYWMNDVTRSKFIFSGRKEMSDFIDLEALSVKLF